MLRTLPEINFSIDLLNLQYRALTDSTRSEYHQIVKINHAALLSRLGFVAQEMKDFQAEVLNDIQIRADEINNGEGAECILDARHGLNISAKTAGEVLMFAAMDFMQEINVVNDVFITPILETIDHLTSLFEIEIIVQLGSHNPVKEFETTVYYLSDEVAILEMLFEFFVSEIHYDFVIFGVLSGERSALIFPLLDNALNDFKFNGNLIRNSLVNCN